MKVRYICDICGKPFDTEAEVIAHEKVHEEEKLRKIEEQEAIRKIQEDINRFKEKYGYDPVRSVIISGAEGIIKQYFGF